MRFKFKFLGGWWIVSLLSVAELAGISSDVRLVDAVEKGDHQAVRSLLEQGVDVNTTQADGATALSWAVHWDDLDTSELLIRAGANVNAANDYGITPLSLACTNGSAVMVQKLLNAGAHPNAAPRTGETALMTCARTGNFKAVKSLLAHGAEVNAKETRGGQTALMWAVAEKHPQVARMLIEHGADVHVRSKGGFTPLLFAAQQGDIDSAQILLEAGVNVNEVTPDGMSALLLASASGHEAFSIFLLEKGADPNAAETSGATALYYALQKGLTVLCGFRFDSVVFADLFRPTMLELVKMLLARGADPNAQLLQAPPRFGFSPLISLHGTTPFMAAAAAGDVSAMRLLAARGANPLLGTKENVTPLMVAAGVGRNEDRTDEEERASLEAVKLLLELGADVNTANKSTGQTALHGAAYVGANAIIQLLVDKGAKIDVKDNFGQTPLSIAEAVVPEGFMDAQYVPERVHKSTADLLRKLGAMH